MTIRSWLGRRVPFVPQMEVTECGAASLAMVLASWGCHVPLAELRRVCAISRDGASALDIVKASRTYGLVPKALKVAHLDGLAGVALPAILHWELNHFVVLERLERDVAHIVDPAVGRRRVSREELDRAFSGVVVTFARGPAFAPRRRDFRGAATYRRLLSGAGRGLLVGGACALLLEALGLLVPAAAGFVVDVVVRPHQDRWLGALGIALAFALALRVVLQIGRERVVGGVEARLQVELATELVKHLLALPMAFHSQRGTGDLLARTSALLAARDAFTRLLAASFDLLLVLAYALMMVLYDARLGIMCVLVEVGLALASWAARRRAKPAASARQIAAGRAHAALVQAFAEPETAKAFGAEDALLARFAAARTSELNVTAEIDEAIEPAHHALALASAVTTALVLALGGHAVLEDRMTLGTLTAFLALQALLAKPLGRVAIALQSFAELGPVLDRVDDVFETAPEPTGTFLPGAGIRGEITFENVSFRHGPKSPLLLDDVSFRVAPGERVAIVGASGSGKSTILRLVLGLVTPTSGCVRIDGRPVAEYDAGALRAATGAVLGSGAFFDGTVFDNVALGASDADAAEVREALAIACADDVVEALPEGLLTRLGPGATRLSGGQRQRLLLARALVKQPELLVLDEASSALDAALEARLHENLARTRCTTLLVAHRPAAVAFADRVLVLAGGKLTPSAMPRALAAPEVQLVRRLA